jgi:hypothetical protein
MGHHHLVFAMLFGNMVGTYESPSSLLQAIPTFVSSVTWSFMKAWAKHKEMMDGVGSLELWLVLFTIAYPESI